MARFDLVSEPWLPVRCRDGTSRELGIRELLLDAHYLDALVDPMPTVEFGLYRLLIALVHDIHREAGVLKSLPDLGDLVEEARFSPAIVNGYLDRYADRFDLFDPKHPFLQSAGVPNTSDKPLATLLPAVPTSGSSVHFHHAVEDDFAASPAAAARLLTSIAPFMQAGGRGYSPSINGAPAWHVLVRGANLFETLLLNCCLLPMPAARKGDLPAWRSDERVVNERRASAGLLESLTWQPRVVQLRPAPGGACTVTGRHSGILVRRMGWEAGWGAGFEWRDPALAYQTGKKGTSPLRPQEGRELWRSTGPLALLRQQDANDEDGLRFERPLVVDQYYHLRGVVPAVGRNRLNLTVYGIRTDNAKVFEWQKEDLLVPAELGAAGIRIRVARDQMDKADTCAYELRRAIKCVYPRDGAGNKKACEGLIATAQRAYWAQLRGSYDALLDTLAAGDEPAALAAVETWANEVKRAAMAEFETTTADMDTATDLARVVRARRLLAIGLWKAFAPPESKQGRKRRESAPAQQTDAATTPPEEKP